MFLPNFVRGGYNRAISAPANLMATGPQPLANQLSELQETVHRYELNQPSPYVSQQPSAPEADDQEPIFPEVVMEEPPRVHSTWHNELYPDISVKGRFKLIKEYLTKRGTHEKAA